LWQQLHLEWESTSQMFRFVIHRHPKSLESYYRNRTETGRDGGEGHCLAYTTYKEM
jgi:ATP-dependent DNA helicase RecQ